MLCDIFFFTEIAQCLHFFNSKYLLRERQFTWKLFLRILESLWGRVNQSIRKTLLKNFNKSFQSNIKNFRKQISKKRTLFESIIEITSIRDINKNSYWSRFLLKPSVCSGAIFKKTWKKLQNSQELYAGFGASFL